jgi:hypothetical protein
MAQEQEEKMPSGPWWVWELKFVPLQTIVPFPIMVAGLQKEEEFKKGRKKNVSIFRTSL